METKQKKFILYMQFEKIRLSMPVAEQLLDNRKNKATAPIAAAFTPSKG